GRETGMPAVMVVIGFVWWPRAMFRSTPKDSARWPVLANRRHGIEIAAPVAADRGHLPQPVLSRVQQRDRTRTRARPRAPRPPPRLGGQRLLFRPVRRAGAGRHVVRSLWRTAHGIGTFAACGGGRDLDRRLGRRARPDRRPRGGGRGLRRLLHVG